MDFDVGLSKFQGTLYSLGTQNLLNRQDKISFVISAILEVSQNLSEKSKAKLVFFMVLNSKLPFIERLKDDENLALFTGIIPSIDVSYLITYVYHCGLENYLFKVIENCPAALGKELINPIKLFLFEKGVFDSSGHYQLWKCLFAKILKINAGLSTESSKEFISQFQDVFFLIKKFIISLFNDSVFGFQVYKFLKTVLAMVRLRKNSNITGDPLYKMNIQTECEEIEEDNIDCISFIFKNMDQILQNLSLVWMDFSDCYFDGSSYQMLIGGVVHSLLEEAAEYDLPPGLSNFAINTTDVRATADIDVVISEVKKGSAEWFKGLVRHSAFVEKKSIECMIEYLKLGSEDDLNVILHTSYEHIAKSEVESLDLLKKLFLKALKATDWSRWVDRIFEEYRPDLLTTPETQDEIVRNFNKISKEKKIPDCDLILLCMQSPCETIKKICEMAICSSQQIELSVDMLKLLKRACEASHSEGVTLLDYVFLGFLSEDLTDKAKQIFVNLVVRLGKENFVGQMFFNKLLGKIKGFLEEGRLDSAVVALKIVEGLLDFKLFQVDAPVFLVFMCQVLGFFSWDLKSFSAVKADGREVAGRVVASSINKLNDFEGVKFEWARQEIFKASELNQSYFCDLWFFSGQVWFGSGKFHSCLLALCHSRCKADDSRKYLLSFDKPVDLIASIIFSLFVLLPVVTWREWNLIFEQLIIVWRNKDTKEVHYDVLDMFGSSLQVLTSQLNEDAKIRPSYEYCMRNFARLAKQHLEKMNGRSILKIFEKIFVMLGTIVDKSKRKYCWEIFSTLMFDLIDCMKRNKVTEANRELIKKLLSQLDSKDVAEAIEKRLE